ncbi:hypothetical protein K469DRAFT_753072 [Zopfia rhizophila CBS 207.26]|uniref:Uncharacterized protein n=1 Tax=Zopfia rhizophila CBS 207.26 TaxID=1314779 RepID=A0A6A6DPV4_9PEZI|nr:hypothetical protein K469DRAFT_753072 [Zopfia rhizophila CBS 207.26]
MDAVLESLKNLLTNLNFVSVEEVELQEEEIGNREEVSTITEEGEEEDGTSSVFDNEVDEADDFEYLPSRNGEQWQYPVSHRVPQKVAFSASIPDTPSQMEDENAGASGIDLVGVEKPTRPGSSIKLAHSEERASRPTSLDSRIPRQRRYIPSTPRSRPRNSSDPNRIE